MRKKKYGTRRRLFLFGSIAIAIIVSISSSVIIRLDEMSEKRKEKDFLEAKLDELMIDEAKVERNLEKLRDPDYVARYAREKYLYSKEDEFIIRIP